MFYQCFIKIYQQISYYTNCQGHVYAKHILELQDDDETDL